jgi:hypothetical protein
MFIPTGINTVKFRTTMRVSGYLYLGRTTSLFGSTGAAFTLPQIGLMARLARRRNRSTDRHIRGLFNWSFTDFVVDVPEDSGKSLGAIRSKPRSAAIPYAATPPAPPTAPAGEPWPPGGSNELPETQGLAQFVAKLKAGAACA